MRGLLLIVLGIFVGRLLLPRRRHVPTEKRSLDDAEPPLYPREDRPFFVVDRADDVDPKTRVLQ